MDKFALLVGVSGGAALNLPTVPTACTNAEVLERSLTTPHAGFDVQRLCDVEHFQMAAQIEQFFRHRDTADQAFFLFSGYIIQDTDNQLYLTTPASQLDDRGHLVRSRTIPLNSLVQWMNESPAHQQVIIFDAWFHYMGEPDPDADGSLEPWFNAMVSDRRVILTASSQMHPLPDPAGLETWSYTRYLAEGAETGAADTDCDGLVTVKEWHQYAQRKLHVAIPAQSPQFYAPEAPVNQAMLCVPSEEPAVRYRQFLEKLVQGHDREASSHPETTRYDHIDQTEFRLLTGRNRLNEFRQHLGLSQTEATEIETAVLRPYWEYQQRKQTFHEYLAQLIEGHHGSK